MNKDAADSAFFKVANPKGEHESYRKGFAVLSDWRTALPKNHFCFWYDQNEQAWNEIIR